MFEKKQWFKKIYLKRNAKKIFEVVDNASMFVALVVEKQDAQNTA